MRLANLKKNLNSVNPRNWLSCAGNLLRIHNASLVQERFTNIRVAFVTADSVRDLVNNWCYDYSEQNKDIFFAEKSSIFVRNNNSSKLERFRNHYNQSMTFIYTIKPVATKTKLFEISTPVSNSSSFTFIVLSSVMKYDNMKNKNSCTWNSFSSTLESVCIYVFELDDYLLINSKTFFMLCSLAKHLKAPRFETQSSED